MVTQYNIWKSFFLNGVSSRFVSDFGFLLKALLKVENISRKSIFIQAFLINLAEINIWIPTETSIQV